MLTQEIRIIDPKVQDHIDTFRVMMMVAASRTVFPELLDIFGMENALKFMDIFGGLTIRIPDRSILENVVRDVDIYHTTENGSKSDEVLDYLGSKYDMTRDEVRRRHASVLGNLKKYGLEA